MQKSLLRGYHRLFALHEIETSEILQLLYYVVSFSFFVTFFLWIERSVISISTFQSGGHVCPPYLPSCGEYYFLQALPYGYTQSAFYVFLFLVLGYGVYSAYRKNWVAAHGALLVCLVWKVVLGFFLTYGVLGNFDYYDMILASVWLFMREKEYFAKITFVFLYVLASSIKIDGGWIFANYFNSLFTGAPIFAAPYLPFFTNILIAMQMIGSWFLLSSNSKLQKAAFFYFLLFHAYSGIIVNYRYIAISIPALFVLFSQPGHFQIQKVSKTTLLGYGFLFLLICGQLIGILTPGDQKKTLEGNYYGLYMFEANHQCISETTTYRKDAEPVVTSRENHVANNRCDPYRYWFPLKTLCTRDSIIERIAWTFDHSINGGAYERIVDVEDACALTYRAIGHNDWIQIDKPEFLGTPVYKTGFGYNLNSQIKVPPEIIIDDPLLEKIKLAYWILWSASLAFACGALIYVHLRKR